MNKSAIAANHERYRYFKHSDLRLYAFTPDYVPLFALHLEIFSWTTVYTKRSRVAISEATMFMGVLHACSSTHCSILGKLLFITLGKLSQSRMMYLRILASSGSVRFNPQTKKPAGCKNEQKSITVGKNVYIVHCVLRKWFYDTKVLISSNIQYLFMLNSFLSFQ